MCRLRRTKKVDNRELEFNRICSFKNISPKIISIEPCKDGYNMTTLKYDNLDNYVDEEENLHKDFVEKYRKQIVDIIKKLHKCGIYHGDIHYGNFVIDKINNKIYLIDFGNSKYINEMLREDEFDRYCENPDMYTPLKDEEKCVIKWLDERH